MGKKHVFRGKFGLLGSKWRWIAVAIVVLTLSLLPLIVNIRQLREDEKDQIELWGGAMLRKISMYEHANTFAKDIIREREMRIRQFAEAYKIILSQDETQDLSSPKIRFYTDIIMNNKTIPVILTDEFNNIQLSQNVTLPKDCKVLRGELLKRFTVNKPIEYEAYGMKFRLYYSESDLYVALKRTVDEINTSFLEEVAQDVVKAPCIFTSFDDKEIIASANIDLSKDSTAAKNEVRKAMKRFDRYNEPITIKLDNRKYHIHYQLSKTVYIMQYYPFLLVVLILLIFTAVLLVFRYMKKTEQNSVWIGLSKETAHQLGTPISGLKGWVQLLGAKGGNEMECEEMTKDLDRLDVVTQRFSQIGSVPKLTEKNLAEVVNNSAAYVSARFGRNIKLVSTIDSNEKVMVPLNEELISWCFENIMKNAVDAMEAKGEIRLSLRTDSSRAYIDISDTGKGINRGDFNRVFEPGYTTKKRGWGLGLSLVRRIVEEYHKGSVYVSSSQIGKGTTFTVELPLKR